MWTIKSLVQLEEEGLVQLGRGKVISKRDLAANAGNYPVYSSSKVGDGKFGEYGLYMFDEELITWSVDGGGRLFHREKHRFSITNVTGFLRILDTSVLSYKYLFHALCLLHSKINFDWVKKAHPSVLRKEYLHIPIPPLAEQQRIVAKLDAAFAEIDRSYEFAKEQDGLSRALYENALNDIYSNLEREYPSVRLMEVCEKIQDGAHHSPKNLYDEREDGLYPYVTSKNIRTNYMITDSIKYADAEFHNSIYERCNAKFGDVLLTKDGANTGNVCLNEFDEPISLLSSVCLLRGKEGVLLDDYLCFFLQSPIGFKRITGSMTGAAIKRIILKTIKKTKIPLPPIDVQMEMTEKISALLIKIQRLEGVYQKKARELNALKSAILAQELQPPQSKAA